MAGPSVAPTIAESTLNAPSVNRLAPASGRPYWSSWRACALFQPGRTKYGAATLAAISATMQPATPPQAKLMAPSPEKASQTVTAAPTPKLSKSTTIRRPWANSRVSSASGTAQSASMITQRHRTRSIRVASGEPSSRAMEGAVAYSATYSAALVAIDRVKTVRAKLRISPSHRMIAALTPSSFALSRTARTICDTAYRPYTSGPNTVRASTTPTRKALTRITMLFSMLHRVPTRTLLSRSALSRSALAAVRAGRTTRGRSGAVHGYSGGSSATASAGPMTSATRSGSRAAPAAACRTARYTVRSRNISRPTAASAADAPTANCTPSCRAIRRATNTISQTPAAADAGTASGMLGQMARDLSSVKYKSTRNNAATRTSSTATARMPFRNATAATAGTSVASQINWKIRPRREEASTAK